MTPFEFMAYVLTPILVGAGFVASYIKWREDHPRRHATGFARKHHPAE